MLLVETIPVRAEPAYDFGWMWKELGLTRE